jgi:hypothetical protein
MAIKKFLDMGKPAPLMDAIVNGPTGMLSPKWQDWFVYLSPTLHSIPNIVNVTELTGQGAAITATDFSRAVLPAGLYRASYLARITTAAGVSSSLTVVLRWTDGGVAKALTGAAITGNTTATYQSGSVLIYVDAGTDVTYTTTYASNAAGVMKYGLAVFLERISA